MISTHEADRQIERLALHVILAHIWRLELDIVFDIVKALVVVLAIELVHHILSETAVILCERLVLHQYLNKIDASVNCVIFEGATVF